MEVWNLCLRVPRKRLAASLLGSAANTQHCMHVGLGQPAEAPTQTMERVEKALATLQSIERFACDQHKPCQLCEGVDVDESRMPWIMISGWSHRQ